jgi:hypothetical protein
MTLAGPRGAQQEKGRNTSSESGNLLSDGNGKLALQAWGGPAPEVRKATKKQWLAYRSVFRCSFKLESAGFARDSVQIAVSTQSRFSLCVGTLGFGRPGALGAETATKKRVVGGPFDV